MADTLPRTGYASVYADYFEGKTTANGDTFRQAEFTAAILPRARWNNVKMGTLLRISSGSVTVVVKLNDKGAGNPAADQKLGIDRVLDLSRAAAGALLGRALESDSDAFKAGLIHLHTIEILKEVKPLGIQK